MPPLRPSCGTSWRSSASPCRGRDDRAVDDGSLGVTDLDRHGGLPRSLRAVPHAIRIGPAASEQDDAVTALGEPEAGTRHDHLGAGAAHDEEDDVVAQVAATANASRSSRTAATSVAAVSHPGWRSAVGTAPSEAAVRRRSVPWSAPRRRTPRARARRPDQAQRQPDVGVRSQDAHDDEHEAGCGQDCADRVEGAGRVRPAPGPRFRRLSQRITAMTSAWNTNAARQLIADVIRPPISGPAAAPTPPSATDRPEGPPQRVVASSVNSRVVRM